MPNKDGDSPDTLAVSASLFDRHDRQMARNYVGFALGSVRRHRLLAFMTFFAIVGATVGSFFAFPKTYHVETKALAEPSSALTVHGEGTDAAALTRVAADTVLREDNLLALIRETDLLHYMKEHRAPVQRARDALLRLVRGHEDTEADQRDALVKLLEKKLVVWTSDSATSASGSTVTIAIDWPDAPMACRLVDAAQRAFLDDRYAREVTALQESIAILETHITTLKSDIDEAVGGIERMRSGESPKASAAPASSATRPHVVMMQRQATPERPGRDPEVQQLKLEIQANQRAIDEVEDLHRRRLSDLQARLVEARATYTENHPTIVDLKQQIAALSVDPAQLTSLRKEAASLKAEYDQTTVSSTAGAGATAPAVVWGPAPATAPPASAATPPQLPSDVLRIALDLREDRDPAMVYARGELRDAMDKYAALRAQIQTGQIDLETAKAAFKYRYTVVTPARLPRRPTVPNIPVVTLVAVVTGMLCGLLLAVLVDVRKGRLLESWQVEHLLERPVIGDITLPDELAEV